MSRVRRLDSSQAYYSVKSALRSIFEVLFYVFSPMFEMGENVLYKQPRGKQ